MQTAYMFQKKLPAWGIILVKQCLEYRRCFFAFFLQGGGFLCNRLNSHPNRHEKNKKDIHIRAQRGLTQGKGQLEKGRFN